jgi:hypothetical protein
MASHTPGLGACCAVVLVAEGAERRPRLCPCTAFIPSPSYWLCTCTHAKSKHGLGTQAEQQAEVANG